MRPISSADYLDTFDNAVDVAGSGICPARDAGRIINPALTNAIGPSTRIVAGDPIFNDNFCIAWTSATNAANTADLLTLINSGATEVGSLVITTGGVTFNLGDGAVTFPINFADGVSRQLQICVSPTEARLYLGCGNTPVSTESFNSTTNPIDINSFAFLLRSISTTEETYDVSCHHKTFIIQCVRSIWLPY